MDLDEFRQKQKQFLHTTCHVARGGRGVAAVWEVAKKLGMDELDADFMVDYLQNKGLLERADNALFVKITPRGLDRIRKEGG